MVAGGGALVLAAGCLLDRSGVLGASGEGGAEPTSTSTAEGGFSATTSANGGATTTTSAVGGGGGQPPSTGGTGGEPVGVGGAGGAICPGPIAATPAVTCPPQCTPGSDCVNGTCIINCNGNQKCKAGAMPTCPSGYHCVVDCSDTQACEDAVVNCPFGTSCSVSCGAGNETCKNLQIQCDSLGPCNLACAAANVCELTDLNCQLGSCTAQCEPSTSPKPEVHCGSACNCEPC
jgi:hypothetical protein